ncbi:MAG TPA: hypothetical protein VLT86_10820 [Vicinamibacterales bacterium]|nr:hypothetical protein [Vicinamibacterales bacterium]
MFLSRLLIAATFSSLSLTATVALGQDARQTPDPNAGKRPVKVVIYPILVQTPLYGASIDLPALPGGGTGGDGDESGNVSGSTGVALNSAYLVGFLVETNRVFVEASGTWADVSADRQSPHISVKTKTLLFQARGGVRVFKGISLTGGVHHVSIDLDALLDLPRLGKALEGTAKPGYWDPMIGADWRGQHGRWEFQAGFEGGGFGVGTDVDLSGTTRVDYRIGWFDMRFGYSISHLEATVPDVSIGRFQRELKINQTLHGPNFGIGIAF